MPEASQINKRKVLILRYNTPMDDVSFVQRCCAGEKAAWDEFLKQYSRLIYNYILSIGRTYGAGLSEHDSDEIFQSVIEHLHKDDYSNLISYQGRNGCSFATWLRIVAMRRAVSFLRSRKNHFTLDESRAEDGQPAVDGTIDGLINAERKEALADCIKRLAREDRYFIQLHMYAGLTLDMLKDHLRTTRAAVDMRKTRLLRQLRECFITKGFVLDSAV